MPWFNKYYRCPCGTEWQDEWDCLCNDRCPTCDTECEPYDHAKIDLNSEDKANQDTIMYGTGIIRMTETGIQSIPFIMLIRKDVTNEKANVGTNRSESGNSVEHPVSRSKSSDNSS